MHRQNGMWEFGIIIFFDFLYTIYSPILCFIYVCTVCLHQLFCHFHHIYHTYTFQEHYKIKNNPTRFSIFYFVFNWFILILIFAVFTLKFAVFTLKFAVFTLKFAVIYFGVGFGYTDVDIMDI